MSVIEAVLADPSGRSWRVLNPPAGKKRRRRRRPDGDPGVRTGPHTVLERDGNRCVECGTSERLTLDHIVPRSKGGTSEQSNLQTMCKPCNERKSDAMPSEADLRRWAAARRRHMAVLA